MTQCLAGGFHAAPHPISRPQAGVRAGALKLRAEAVALDLEVAHVVAQSGDKEINFAVASLRVLAQAPGVAREVIEGGGLTHC